MMTKVDILTMKTAAEETREDKIGHIGREIVDGVPLGGTATAAFDGSVSVSRRGAADKEPSCLAFQMRYHNN